MASMVLLTPTIPGDVATDTQVFEPSIVRVQVLSGTEGSVVEDETTLVPAGFVRVRMRTRKNIDKRYFAQLFSTTYRIIGMRTLPPRGLWSDLILEIVDTELRILDKITLGGFTVTIKGNEITI